MRPRNPHPTRSVALAPPARFAAAWLGWLLPLAFAFAGPDHTARAFRIPAGPASETLKQFAEQAQREILFPSDPVADVRTPRVFGDYPPRAALDRLLAGTRLRALEVADTDGFVISPAAAAPVGATDPAASLNSMKTKSTFTALAAALGLAAAPLTAQPAPAAPTAAGDDPIQLSVFEVSTKADRGYLATSSLSASRINTPIADVPQSLFVLTEEMVRDQAPTGLADILRFAPGVSVTENNGEAVNIRGFGVSIPLQDGFRYPRGFPSEQADVERVEVLLGPASVLYGNVFGVAGVINRITKQPRFTRATSLQLQFKDQDGTNRFVFDTTDAVAGSKKFTYRLIVAGQRTDNLQDFANLHRLSLYPRLTWKIASHTTLKLGGEYSHQTGGFFNNSGVNYDYVLAGRIIRIPDHANPDQDFAQSNVLKRGGNFSFATSPIPHWAFRVAGYGAWVQTRRKQTPTAAVLNANGQTINRNTGGNLQDLNRGLGNVFFQADASGDYKFEGATLKPIVGVEYSIDSDGTYQKRATTALPAFNFFAPDYTVPLPVGYVFNSNPRIKTYAKAIYANLQAGFLRDRIIINAGTRLTNYQQKATVENATTRVRTTTVENGRTESVPRYGAVFKVTPDIGVYYGYSEGFQVTTGANPDGSTLPPIRGQQKEFGVKASLLESRLVATIARFQLDRVNNPQADPTRTGYRVPAGSERSEGFDLSLVASLTENWQLIAGFVKLTDSKITSNVAAAQVGLDRVGFPATSHNAWTRYRFAAGPLKGLALGAGVNHVAATPVQLATGTAVAFSIPAYTTYDTLVSYDWNKKIRLQFNIRNLTDDRYYPDGNSTRLQVGQTRTFSTTITYHF